MEIENQENFEKKEGKGKFILLVVLVFIVACLGTYILYDKVLNKDKNNDTEIIDKVDDNNNVNTNVKIDESKDFIYVADYDYDVSSETYSTNFKTYNVKDIRVPYININSTYASNANKEIENVFRKAIEAFKNGIKDKSTYVDECNYTYYLDNDVLSVNLWLGVGSTDVVVPDYYTFNFDLKTGNLLSFDEVYRMVGFDPISVNNKIEKTITDKMRETLGTDYPSGTNFDTYNNQSLSNYRNSVSDNSINYFLDKNKNLNVVVKMVNLSSTGKTNEILTIN